MSKVTISIICNTNTVFSSYKAEILNSLKIPYKINENLIYFLSDSDITFSTRNLDGNHFILDMLSDVPKFNLGGNFKNFNSDIQKKLIAVFGKIQLDINLTDSYSGLSDWINFKINPDLSIKYIFDE